MLKIIKLQRRDLTGGFIKTFNKAILFNLDFENFM
jgi:hypothetical protein